MNESIIDQESVALLKHMFIDTGFLWYVTAIIILLFSFRLLFFWEGRVILWLRLPIINIVTFTILLLMGIIEEFYLTCHPEERTSYIRTSIFQIFFTK